eukprot:CAMPEP_0194699918 /NCGR_PEP_ID=MMETSP0295-20121207/25164_1 /TAXON_ID=39354 /ORGANISM="Heterosigma akashiwo, Strain CCMP2393" /LENGTH=64 /DNA_ID=CAMNT_0039593585 /DNA_START=214 /DNA_END=408 /DNA_ORIENTATION=+
MVKDGIQIMESVSGESVPQSVLKASKHSSTKVKSTQGKRGAATQTTIAMVQIHTGILGLYLIFA